MVTVDVEHENGVITEFVLSGDFFLHPEEAVEELEGKLVGADAEGVERAFFEAGERWRLIGAEWTQIRDMVLTALETRP